jgi:vacuolar-type H+-ATPase subunit H
MKQLFTILAICFLLTACGKAKEEANALTPEQETQLVDSVAQHLDEHKNELQQKADSVTNDVDSLLKDI